MWVCGVVRAWYYEAIAAGATRQYKRWGEIREDSTYPSGS